MPRDSAIVTQFDIHRFGIDTAVFASCFLLIISCDITVVSENPASTPYRTKHFTIYCDPGLLSPEEIEQIAVRKESLLDHINSYLGTSYDRTIEVTITDNIWNSHATRTEHVYEQLGYVLSDNGHEIAHIVSLQEWGRPHQGFLIEGCAEAASLPSDAARVLMDHVRHGVWSGSYSLADLSHDIKSDLHGNFDYSYLAYKRAGAFVSYLVAGFGAARFKEWWKALVKDPNGTEQTFHTTYGTPLDTVLVHFTTSVNKEFSCCAIQ